MATLQLRDESIKWYAMGLEVCSEDNVPNIVVILRPINMLIMKLSKFVGCAMVSLVLALSACVCVNAQSWQEIVYLKNGSVIKGLIVEQIPNESLTIKTPDGSKIICNMADVERITKEFPSGRQVSDNNDDVIPVSHNLYSWEKAPRYRGFVGISSTVGIAAAEDYVGIKLYTSHGCQINPYLYLGGGLGVQGWICTYDDDYVYEDSYDLVGIPLFVHARGEFHKAFRKNVSPYWDAKMGYTAGGDYNGFYFSPQIGCHFCFGHSLCGLSVGIGYEGTLTSESEYYIGAYGKGYEWTDNYVIGGVELSVVFDF